MNRMIFDRDHLAAALEAADDKIAEEVFIPGSQMESESLEGFSRRYWLARADAALNALGLADAFSDEPSEPVKRAAVAIANEIGDNCNHPFYAGCFQAGLAAFLATDASCSTGADATEPNTHALEGKENDGR